MAILRIDEFKDIMRVGEGSAQIPLVPELARQQITYAANTASADFNAQTKIVRLVANADCYIAFGSEPEVDPEDVTLLDGIKLVSGTEYYFGVLNGTKLKVYDGSS